MAKRDPSWVSVEYYSHNPPKASWLGVNVRVGGMLQFPSRKRYMQFGAGYTFRIGVLPLTLLIGYQSKLSPEHRRILSATAGLALPIHLKSIPLAPPDGIWLETGWIRAREGERKGGGTIGAVGTYWQLVNRVDRFGCRLQVQYNLLTRGEYVPHGLSAHLIFH